MTAPHGLILAALLLGLAPVAPSLAQSFRCPAFHSGFEPGAAEALNCRARVNDSGADRCLNAQGEIVACPHVLLPGQDGESGRDALAAAGQLPKRGFGPAGYDFSKLDAAGNELPVRAIRWSCLRDNRSGRIWEVKLDDPASPRHHAHGYSWYHPSAGVNGTPLGSTGNTQSCNNSLGGQPCNTHALVQATNAAQLCGRSDWRLPRLAELLDVVDFGTHPVRPIAGVFERISTDFNHYYRTDTLNVIYTHSLSVGFNPTPTVGRELAADDRVLLVAGQP